MTSNRHARLVTLAVLIVLDVCSNVDLRAEPAGLQSIQKLGRYQFSSRTSERFGVTVANGMRIEPVSDTLDRRTTDRRAGPEGR